MCGVHLHSRPASVWRVPSLAPRCDEPHDYADRGCDLPPDHDGAHMTTLHGVKLHWVGR